VQAGLTNTSVYSLAFSGTNLFAGTYGGVWRRPVSEMTTSIEKFTGNLLLDFNLSQNYPNPFNPTTNIYYRLPSSSMVCLSLYSLTGQELIRLVDGFQETGDYTVQWNAKNYPAGIYLYRISAGNYSETRKCLLLK
jgi:hypothetical protein